MSKDKFLSSLDALQMKNRALMIGVIGLLAFSLMNMIALSRARSHQQTVIVPVGGGAGMTVGGGRASHEYLRTMARYITSMVGTYTASTARPQLQELLGLFAPEKVGAVQLEFEKIAAQIERFPSISSVIRWAGDDALKVSDSVMQVRAARDRMINGQVNETADLHYCIEYRIDESRLWIVGLREVEGPGADLCLNPKALAEREARSSDEKQS